MFFLKLSNNFTDCEKEYLLSHILRKQYTYMKDNMDVNDKLIAHLHEKEVINKRELENINSSKMSSNKAAQLLFLIQRSSWEEFEIFLQALVQNRQGYLSKLLC